MSHSLRNEVREFALGLPEAWEDRPWGESVAKVGRKVFVFFGTDEADVEGVRVGVKLPASHDEALMLPFATPMGYGLDRGNWVWISAPPDAPAEMLTGWIEESYRAVASKALVAVLEERP